MEKASLAAKGYARAATGAATVTSRVGSAARSAAPWLSAGLALGLAKSVSEAREANKVLAQTEAAIKSNGSAANMTAGDIAELADQISLKSGIDDEAIQSSENLLLCLEESAEALTRDRGWVTHSELSIGDEILAYDPDDDTTRWEPVRDLYRYEVETELIRWKSKQIDVATTPHHRWWTVGQHDRARFTPQFQTTEQITGKQVRVKIGGGAPASFADKPTLDDDLVELAAWVFTEGTFPKWVDQSRPRRTRTCSRCGENDARNAAGPAVCDDCAQRTIQAGRTKPRVRVTAESSRLAQVSFCQSLTANPDLVSRIRALVERLRRSGHRIGESESRAAYNGSTIVSWHFANDLGRRIRQLLPGKKLTPAFIAGLTAEQATNFLDVLILADGSIDARGQRQFIQKDSTQLDLVAMLCSMLGIRTSRLGRGDSLYLCSTNHLKGSAVNARRESYKGIVWCPQIRTQIFMARNRGRSFWTGNTFQAVRNEAGKGNDVFTRATQVTTDLSAAWGQDLSMSAKQVGKALNDPVAGLTALSRVGVQFTADQKEMITGLVESGKTLQAQKLILRELESQVGGSAAAQADSFDKLQVSAENFAEKVGGVVTPVLSDMADELSGILSNDKLTGAQRVDKLSKFFEKWTSKGLDALSDAAPEIASTAGEIGLDAVEAFAGAWWDSDLLGKIFLGGAALRLFGGPGVFGKLGGAMATTIAGGMKGQFSRLSPGAFFGGPMAAVIAAGIYGLSEDNKINAAIDHLNKVVERPSIALSNMFRVNPNVDTESLREAIEGYTALGKISEKSIWKWVESGKITAAQGQRMIDILEEVNKRGGRALLKLADQYKDTGHTVVADFTDPAAAALKGLEGDTDKQTGKMGDDFGRLRRVLDRTGGDVKDFADLGADALAELADHGDKSNDKLARSTERMVRKASADVMDFADAVGDAYRNIDKNTDSAAHALGLTKKVDFAITGVGGAAAGVAGVGRQAGGAIGRQSGGSIFAVPGVGDGDQFPLMAPPGSFVLNRNAARTFFPGLQSGGHVPTLLEPGELFFPPEVVARMGGWLDWANDSVRRFQGGGSVGSTAAMLALANKFDRADEPYSLGGGHGSFLSSPAPVDCSGAVSAVLHAGGLLQGAPMDTVALASWGRKATGNEPLVVATRPITGAGGHTVMKIGNRVFGTSGENPGGGAGWLSSSNPRDYVSGAVLRTMGVTGGGSMPQIRRPVLTGPDGPWKSIGQAGIDRTVKAARAWVSDHMPSGSFGGGDLGSYVKASGSVVGQIGRVTMGHGMNRTGAAALAGNAYQESTWNPSSVEGLWGFHSSPVSIGDVRSYATRMKQPWDSAALQSNFLMQHLSPDHGGYSASFANQLNAGPLASSVGLFMREWERPNLALANEPRRLQGAQMALKMFQRGGRVGGGAPRRLARGGRPHPPGYNPPPMATGPRGHMSYQDQLTLIAISLSNAEQTATIADDQALLQQRGEIYAAQLAAERRRMRNLTLDKGDLRQARAAADVDIRDLEKKLRKGGMTPAEYRRLDEARRRAFLSEQKDLLDEKRSKSLEKISELTDAVNSNSDELKSLAEESNADVVSAMKELQDSIDSLHETLSSESRVQSAEILRGLADLLGGELGGMASMAALTAGNGSVVVA